MNDAVAPPDATDPALAALRAAHERELQRQALGLADRLRQAEAERLRLQERLEELGDEAADRFDALQARTLEAAAAASARLAEQVQREAAAVAEAAALRERAAAAQDRLQELRQHYDTLQSNQAASLARLREGEQALEAARRSHAAELAKAHADVAALRAQAADLQTQLVAAHQARDVLEGERDALQARCQTAEDALQAQKAAAERAKAEYDATYRDQARRAEELLAAARADAAAAALRADNTAQQAEAAAKQAETAARQAQAEAQQAAALQAALSAELADAQRESARVESEARRLRSDVETALLRATQLGTELQTSQSLVRQFQDSEQEARTRVAALQSETQMLQRALESAHREADALRQSRSFRLGQALVQTRHWRGVLRFPTALLDAVRGRPQAAAPSADRGASRGAAGAAVELSAADLALLESTLARDGAAAAAEALAARRLPPQREAHALTQLARQCVGSDVRAATSLARRAATLDPRPFRQKWLGFLLADAGAIVEAQATLAALPGDVEMKASERLKRRRIEGLHRLLSTGVELPPPSAPAPQGDGPLMYVAASALPYHVSGYTQRTHALLLALQAQGHDVVCVTRPGYPDDRADARQAREHDTLTIDGIRYRSLPGPGRQRLAPDEYLRASATRLAAEAQALGARAIHAASNHENALPALLAARQLGLPFVYEVRGLWEYTAASKRPGWEDSDAFRLDVQLESLVAGAADRVFTLNAAMAVELQRRGVAAETIALAPNGIDPDRFVAAQADPALRARHGFAADDFVVGYAGSVVGYEGLDDLLAAFGLLRDRLPRLRLLIVGQGDALPALKAQAGRSGAGERIVFTGAVAPQDVPAYLAVMDVVAMPRKPVTVCQLVSPLKPLEAMAMARPVVVSNVAALAEMVRDGETGIVAAAADPAALAAALARLAADPAAARQMGEAARAATLADRSWSQVAASMATAHPGLSAAASAATNAAPPAPADIPPLNLPAGITSLDDAQKAELDRRLIEAATQGAPALRGLLERQNAALPARLAAFSTLRAAQAALDAGLQDDALALGTEALARDGAPGTLRALARLHANAADFNQAAALARRLEAALPSVGDADRRFIDEQVEREALERETAQRQAAAFEPVVGRALNLLAFSLPYTSVGYATRSHGTALGIQHAGWDIRPFTRPGFPQDFKPELQGQALPDSDCIDGITYGRLFAAARVGSSEVEYMRSSAAHYERLIRELRPQVVHAASNYVTALPALVAARRCGVPFIYEVRGFWEVTRSSRDAGFERTPKFRHMERFERVVALNADRVITITTAMRDELVARGVAADRIDIAFNSVDPARFSPRPRDEALAQRLGLPAGVPVIGYVGSFVDYEGLDDLVTAAAGLRDQGADFRMLLVGDGAVFQSLIDQVQALGLDDLVTLTGRVPHDEVEAYYSLIDVAPFPRKPWEVCELVSPLKPFEAMALHKPVVVSSTRALLEIVEDGVNGLLFDKGSPASLQEALHRLVTDASLRAALGERARGWIERERSWDRAGQVVVGAYDHTIGGAGVRC